MDWLTASSMGLATVVTALGAVVLSLIRQVGVLHERTAPAGIASHGLRQTRRLDTSALTVRNLSGGTRSLGDFAAGRPLAMLFVAPDCPLCKALLPSFWRAFAQLDLPACYVGGAESPEVHARYVSKHALDPGRYLLGQDLIAILQVAHTPTLILIDGSGQVTIRETLRGPAHLAAISARLVRERKLGVPHSS